MDLIMRNETEADYRQVEALTREAFWNVYVPGCEEHYLAHVIRGTKEFIPESSIVSEQGETYPVITFGPLSVLPSCQKSGVGRKLIEYTKEKAAQMGFLAIVICGDPAYYSRFGFTAAEEFDKTFPPREKGTSVTQNRFRELIGMVHL